VGVIKNKVKVLKIGGGGGDGTLDVKQFLIKNDG